MLKILIVDDNKTKIANVVSLFDDVHYISQDKVFTVYDIVNAKKSMSEMVFDVAIIDINLPTRYGEDPKPNNGIRLIDEIKHSQALHKPTYIIALTEYADLIDKYNSKFYNDMVYLLHYTDSDDGWKRQILSHLDYANVAKQSPYVATSYNFDIAIITALHDPELFYLLKLDAKWQKRKHPNDSTMYYEGVFTNGVKKLKVVAAASPQMGMPASTTLATKIIEHYRPRYISMVGIAAGVNGKCGFGDLLIADISWDYGSGKIRRKGRNVVFEPDPKSLNLSPDLKEKFLSIVREREFLDEIKSSWKESLIETELNVFIGPIASGAAVLEDPILIKDIMIHNRKLIGIEMEIYGLFYAATHCTDPKPVPFAIKSVSDFGDNSKHDGFQKYASYVSSMFMYLFSLSEL